MEEKKDSSLGKALTMLGLEDQFLSNGELSNFPLAERGKIANDIISEKLRRGRWETVIEMIYGGLGKADALYDGDRNKLRGDIVNSAVEDSKKTSERCYLGSNLTSVLKKAGENELLFDLMTKLPLRYEEFAEIRDYKLNPKHDAEKERILDNTQGKLAFAEQKYNDALAYFTRAGNQEAIDKVFEIALNPKRVYTSGINISLAEEAALSNPDKKESRLKKIVLGYSPGSANPLPAYQLMKKHNIKLSPEENELLIRKIAGLNDWNFEKNVPESESGIRLLWAKKHVQSEPRRAYQIFTEQEYDGKEVNSAIISGLKIGYSDESSLHIGDIDKTKLREIYPLAPFEIKTMIAKHLDDKKSLIKLSKEANRKGKLREAYSLFLDSGGNPESEYIKPIRTKLIDQYIQKDSGVMNFLDRSDKTGMTEAYNALIKSFDGKDRSCLSEMHNLAKYMGDEKMIQETRERMFKLSPSWALMNFKSSLSSDEEGTDYVLSEISNSTGVDKGTLENLVSKYKV